MKIKVNPHNVEIIKEQTEPINEKEIKVSKCEFEFDEAITNEFVKEAYFTLNGETYKQIIENNECDYPNEVLTQKGTLEIGVVAFLVENEEEIIRYNPSPDYYDTWVGSLKDAENSEPITPSEMEQFEQQLQEGLNDIAEAIENAERLDVDAEKINKVTTITITKQDGTTKEVTLEDGMGLNYNWEGTSLGVKREDEETYQYVNLKGDKGDAGAIKMIIVNELPEIGQDDTIYLVPLENPDIQGNNYAEYVYINGAWELLGKIGVQVDLTDYYTKTETNSLLDTKQPLIDSTHKLSASLVSGLSNVATSGNYNDLSNKPDLSVYEQLSNKVTSISSNSTDVQYPSAKCVYDIVGDINSALDLINGEVI